MSVILHRRPVPFNDFLFKMVEGLHVTEKQSEVGYYSGFVVCILCSSVVGDVELLN